MKLTLTSIFALFKLCMMVEGAWWAAAVQPVILSLGAVLGALDLDVLDVQYLLPFINKQDKNPYEDESLEEYDKPKKEEADQTRTLNSHLIDPEIYKE